MAIHDSNTNKKCTLYLGAHEPAEIHIGNKKIIGWQETTQTGTTLTFEDTYNDKVLAAKVKGDSVQKSAWRKAEAESTQQTYDGVNLFNINAVASIDVTGEGVMRQGVSIIVAQGWYVFKFGGAIPEGLLYTKTIINGVYGTTKVIDSNSTNIDMTSAGMILVYSTSKPAITGLVEHMLVTSANSAHPYEPYTGGIPAPNPDYPQPITTTIPAGTYRVQDWRGDWYEFTLPSDLHGIGDVRDSVEWDKYNPNLGRVMKKNNKYIFTGNETWLRYASTNQYYTLQLSDAKYDTDVLCYCTHYTGKTSAGGGVYGANSAWFQQVIGFPRFYIYDGTEYATAEGLKVAIATQHTNGTPVTVVYQLATPTRTPLTFTLNNASTAPECPMEFLTSTPSEEYPAEVWDASGTVRTRGKNLFDMSLSTRYDATKKCLVATAYAQSTGIKLKDFLHGKVVAGDVVMLSGITDAPTKKYIYLGAPFTGTWNFGTSKMLTADMLESIVYIYTETLVSPAPTNIFLQIETGTTATAYEPYRPEVTATILTLRKVNALADEYDVVTGKLTKRISDWISLDGSKAFAPAGRFLSNSTFRVSLTLTNYPTSTADVAYVYKYDSTKLPYGNNAVSVPECYAKYANALLYLCVPNTESGWGETVSVTNDEIRSYFHGWRMCHNDGVAPYQRSEVPYNPTTWEGWTKSSLVSIVDNQLVYTSDGTTDYVYAFLPGLAMKTSTKYGLLYNIANKTYTGSLAMLDSSVLSGGIPNAVGNNKVILTSPASFANNRVGFRFYVDAAGNSIAIKDIRIFELPSGSQIEADFTNLTADQLAEKYKFYGLNPKHWKRLVGTEAEITASITPTRPTATYTGYTPYKMLHQLATPTSEQYDSVQLPTFPETTVIEMQNETPATATITATVKTVDLN